jgi:hypothetical protein
LKSKDEERLCRSMRARDKGILVLFTFFYFQETRMAVHRDVVKNSLAIQMRPKEFLLYTLTPAPGGAGIWAFGDSIGSKLRSSDFAHGPFEWQLGGTPPSNSGSHYISLTRSDVYTLDLQFSETPTYKLRVLKQPGNEVIQKISYESRISTDSADTRSSNTESYLEPLDITLIEDEQ